MTDNSAKIGIDLGGTKISLVAYNNRNEMLYRTRTSTPKSPFEVYQSIENLVLDCVREIKAQNYSVGLSMPGTLDRLTYILEGTDPQKELDKRIGSVKIANDANCFTLAESQIGAARGYQNVFGVILGTGVGGGLVINNRLYQGSNGLAGEWGHNTLDSNGKQCWCGNKGCVETVISGPALELKYHWLTGKRLGAEKILNSNELICAGIAEDFKNNLATALSTVVNFIDPDVIVLGGGLSNYQGIYTDIIDRIGAKSFATNFKTPIVQAQLGDDAGVIGATML